MIVLGLGSNIGDRLAYLTAAIHSLSTVLQDITLSRILESKALLPDNATKDMDIPFLNMALRANTLLPVEQLLAKLKGFEQDIGRVERCVWGPREIDIDILAMDDVVLESNALNIPHKELLNRDFALVPLCDVAGDWKYPVQGVYYDKTMIQICKEKNYHLNDTLRDSGLRIHV